MVPPNELCSPTWQSRHPSPRRLASLSSPPSTRGARHYHEINFVCFVYFGFPLNRTRRFALLCSIHDSPVGDGTTTDRCLVLFFCSPHLLVDRRHAGLLDGGLQPAVRGGGRPREMDFRSSASRHHLAEADRFHFPRASVRARLITFLREAVRPNSFFASVTAAFPFLPNWRPAYAISCFSEETRPRSRLSDFVFFAAVFLVAIIQPWNEFRPNGSGTPEPEK